MRRFSLSCGTWLVVLCIHLVGKRPVSAGDTGSCRDGVGYKTDGQGWVTTVEYGSRCGEASGDLSRPGPGGAADQASPTGLDLLFWPLGFNDVADMWEKGPRVVRRGDGGYFARALNFTGDSVEPVLMSAVAVNGTGSDPMKNGVGIDGKDFRLVKRVRGKDGEWWSGGAPGETLDGGTIVGLIRNRGFTLVLNHLDFRHKGVAKMTQEVEKDCKVPAQSNLYLTPPRNQGFEAHWDPMETIVAQVEGRKLWHVYPPLVQLPRPSQRFKPTIEQVEALAPSRRSIMLGAGDTLYMPRGWLHEAATNASNPGFEAQHSIHVTIGVDSHITTWESVGHAAVARAQGEEEAKELIGWCLVEEGLSERGDKLRRGLGWVGGGDQACLEAMRVVLGCTEEAGREARERGRRRRGDVEKEDLGGNEALDDERKGRFQELIRLVANQILGDGEECAMVVEEVRQEGMARVAERSGQRAKALKRHGVIV